MSVHRSTKHPDGQCPRGGNITGRCYCTEEQLQEDARVFQEAVQRDEIIDRVTIPEWVPPTPGTPAVLSIPDVKGRMPLADQLAEFDKRIDAAVDRCIHQLQEPALRQVLKRSARRRLELGVETFGDAGWQKHPDALMVDTIEELADALVYLVMRDYQRRFGPGG